MYRITSSFMVMSPNLHLVQNKTLKTRNNLKRVISCGGSAVCCVTQTVLQIADTHFFLTFLFISSILSFYSVPFFLRFSSWFFLRSTERVRRFCRKMDVPKCFRVNWFLIDCAMASMRLNALWKSLFQSFFNWPLRCCFLLRVFT